MHFNVIEKCCQVHIKQTVVKLSAQIRQSNTKFTHIKNRIMAVVRLYAFFILHRKARKALSFAQIAFCNELTKKVPELGDSQCVYTCEGHTYDGA